MEWHDVITAAGVVLAFFGAVNVIGSGIKIIREWWSPMAKQAERIEKLEERADETDKNYDALKKVLNAQSNLLIEMTTHLITGNDVDALKKKRDELTRTIME